MWGCVNVFTFALQVNIIPIIAKADTIAKNELHKFKSKIMSELVSNGVQIYQFPTDEETVAEINATMSVSPQPNADRREAFPKACVVLTLRRGWKACTEAVSGTAGHLTSLCLSFSHCRVKSRQGYFSFLPSLIFMGNRRGI